MTASDRRLMAVSLLMIIAGLMIGIAPETVAPTPFQLDVYAVVGRWTVAAIQLTLGLFGAASVMALPDYDWRRPAAVAIATFCVAWAVVRLVPTEDYSGNTVATAVWLFAAYIAVDAAPKRRVP